ncbi:glycosyl transferase [Variovorax sp. CF313]|uniref:glycosyltransferase family 2 protein n=1 Tax=Variovorax sp. CF313 TaxID=1144315 RepID=UPI000270E3D2|nr:glycosyl transferase [Variovorax sp. CF313]
MSTYNGEQFLEEQVRSILKQLPDDGTLLIRDDGSTDQTVARVVAFKDDRIRLVQGKNVGFASSFLCLLKMIPASSTSVFFSDQDDVWEPKKIATGCTALAGREEIPRLYCSGLLLVSEHLESLGRSPLWPRKPSFDNALVENIATGCTVALNRAAVTLILRTNRPEQIRYHDWWCYLVVAAFGEVLYDPIPQIRYRQHRQNALGMSSGGARYLRIMQAIRRQSWLGIMQAHLREFASSFGSDISASQKRSLDRMTIRGARDAFRVIFSIERRRQFLRDELLFRLLVAFELVARRDFPFASRR